jgi:hypothetical protein
MFAVRGTYEGVVYTLVIDRANSDPVGGGPMTGSASVINMLNARMGRTVWATPTGPQFVLQPDDDKSILAALAEWTQIEHTEGNVPDVVPPPVRGAVY